MPLTTTRQFRVRYYECDRFGHLNNANYLRFMQETAFDASAAAGYSRQDYLRTGHLWVIRASQVEYLKPVEYDQRVNVTTWIADFRRATSRRMYELHLAESGELAARGFTDWVFVNSQDGRPVAIPDEVQRVFFPEGVPDKFPPREPFPQAPPPPPGAFTTRRRVAWHDLDSAGHVNNAMYLNYAEDCGVQVVAAYGWPVQRMIDAGFAILLRMNQIQYLQPAYLDDELEITTWVSDVRRSSALRHYTITRVSDGALLTRIHTLGVWVDLATGRPVRISAEMLDDFAPNIAETPSRP